MPGSPCLSLRTDATQSRPYFKAPLPASGRAAIAMAAVRQARSVSP